MLSNKKKLQILGAFISLLLAAFAAGCDWFVNPTLTSIAITPASPALETVGQTLQLTATGTYNDGSTQNLTGASGTSWTSSDETVATVSNTGLLKAISIPATTETVTITVTNTTSAGAVSGTATASVGASAASVTVTSNSGTTISITANGGIGTQVFFTADQNSTDVTTQAIWTSSNPSIITIPSSSATSPIPGTLEGTTGSVTITATVSGTSGSVTVVVTQ